MAGFSRLAFATGFNRWTPTRRAVPFSDSTAGLQSACIAVLAGVVAESPTVI